MIGAGLAIFLIRFYIIQYHMFTGEKIIDSVLLSSGFWLQFLLVGIGMRVFYLEEKDDKKN